MVFNIKFDEKEEETIEKRKNISRKWVNCLMSSIFLIVFGGFCGEETPITL